MACRFDEGTKMNAGSSILKWEALEGAGNMLPDPCADVKVKLNNTCSCGHSCDPYESIISIIGIIAMWRAGLTK